VLHVSCFSSEKLVILFSQGLGVFCSYLIWFRRSRCTSLLSAFNIGSFELARMGVFAPQKMAVLQINTLSFLLRSSY
jgi:hypothetical protein